VVSNPFAAAISSLEFALKGADLEGHIRKMTQMSFAEREESYRAAIRLLEAAGKVDKERFIEGIDEANQFGRLHRNVMSGYGLFIEDLEAIAAALPDKVTP